MDTKVRDSRGAFDLTRLMSPPRHWDQLWRFLLNSVLCHGFQVQKAEMKRMLSTSKKLQNRRGHSGLVDRTELSEGQRDYQRDVFRYVPITFPHSDRNWRLHAIFPRGQPFKMLLHKLKDSPTLGRRNLFRNFLDGEIAELLCRTDVTTNNTNKEPKPEEQKSGQESCPSPQTLQVKSARQLQVTMSPAVLLHDRCLLFILRIHIPTY